MIQQTKKKEKNNKELESIRIRTWKFFGLCIIVILVVIWLLQNVFLNSFYTNMRLKEIEEMGQTLTKEYIKGTSIEELITNSSFDSSVRIQIIDDDGNVVFPRDWLGIFYATTYNQELIDFMLADLNSEVGRGGIYNKAKNDVKNQTVFYMSYLGKSNDQKTNLYLMIVALLKPIDSTMTIMRKQFPFIIAVAMIVGTLVSFFISKILSEPVKELTDSAKILATGNYNVVFPKSNLSEINQLSETLNYATGELQKMDRMRVSIVANVSHDLKTPLTVIKSYAEMIKDITGNDKEKRDENLDTIINEADRLTEMVNSILDVSKIEMEMDDLKPERFSLKNLTEEIISRFEVLTSKYHYSFEIKENSDGFITADKSLIDQVIYNFASNAITFAGDDLKIIFEIDENEDRIKYSVTDHGRGIKPEAQEKIWERYYTDHQNHVRNVVGTGLGLHIVKVILKKHGYKYGVDSEVGKGSSFYFIVEKKSGTKS